MSPFRMFLILVVAAPATVQAAITIDGQLDPDYGPPAIVQTLQTGLSNAGLIPGDNTLGDLNYASGSELDAAYALIYDGKLRLFFTGNLAFRLTMQQGGSRAHMLTFFLDTKAGGQNQLNGIGAGNPLNGMTFDAGFEADYWFDFWGEATAFGTDWWAGRGTIDSPGSGAFAQLGHSSAGSDGVLTGPDPFGIRVTIDNRNTAGVTFGCNASSGAGVTRGIEWEIPVSAIDFPEGCIRMIAMVRDRDNSSMSNSVLAPVPDGTCPMGPSQFVNFANIAGDQTFPVCQSVLGAPPPVAGVTLALAGANPARGDRLVFRASVGTLELIDVAGRVVRRRTVDGEGTVELSGGSRLVPGLYWARLTHERGSVIKRICITG